MGGTKPVLQRILVPLDGSDLARNVLSQVSRLLLYEDGEVLLVRAVGVPPGDQSDVVEVPSLLQAQAVKYLEEVAAPLASQGARVRTIARLGNAADVILDVAAEEKATLVAMSTHGRSGIARWALGSVAEKVLRASPIPVLAVRSFSGETAAGTAELALKKILVPMDAADLSKEIVGPATELAKLFGSEIVLLHVCYGMDCTLPIPQVTAADGEFRAAGVPVRVVLKRGNPALEILETAAAEKADLIAMTTHGRAGLTRWTLGSVTEKVLRGSTVPLLVARPSKVKVAESRGRRRLEKSRA
jgi:nucleotide-binding universal stress UspA family protein